MQINNPAPPILDIIYSAGRVAANGTLLSNQGDVVTVTRTAVGRYTVAFTNQQASADYAVLLANQRSAGRDDYKISYYNVTAAQFEVENNEQDNGGTGGVLRDSDFSFAVIRA